MTAIHGSWPTPPGWLSRHRRLRQCRCLGVTRSGRWHIHGPTIGGRQLGYDAGGWRVDRHPRFLADTTGNGRYSGLGNAGVWVSRAQADGTYTAPQLVVTNFGYDAGAGGLISIHGSWPTPLERPSRYRGLWQRGCLGVTSSGRWHHHPAAGGRQLRL